VRINISDVCEGTVVGSKLSEDGVNEHQKRRSRNWYVSEETRCRARQLVNKVIA
jgi:adenosyl cobinamide kinase/adenosyl cobinamide phosphate guanylyltransferase